jgi:hypothetical protein
MSAIGGRRPASFPVWMARAILAAIAVFVATLVHLAIVGLPDWATDYVLRRTPMGPFVLEIAGARCHPIRGLVLKDPRVFIKGVVGPPWFAAREATVLPDFSDWVGVRPAIREVRVTDAVLRTATFAPARGTEPGPPVSFDFRFVGRNLDMLGVFVSDAVCRVRLAEGVLAIERVEACVGVSGDGDPNLTGWVTVAPATRRQEGRIETRFDPVLILPLCDLTGVPFLRKLIGCFGFPNAPPRVSAHFRRDGSEGGGLTVQSRAWLENASYRGVDVLRADTEVLVDRSPGDISVTLDPLLVVRPEGIANVRMTVLPLTKTVHFSGESGLDPRALADMVNVLTNDWTRRVRIEGPVDLRLRGTVDWSDAHRSVLAGTVAGHGIGFGCLLTDSFACDYEYGAAVHKFSGFRGRLFDAQVAGALEISAPLEESREGRFFADIALTDANFERLVSECRLSSRNTSGRMDLRIEMEGPLSGAARHGTRGKGRIEIRDGRIFMLPVFGGMSSHLARAIPGLDFVLRQGDATADFVLKNGRFASEDVAVEGGVLSLKGRGSYGIDGELDYRVQVKLLRDSAIVGRVVRTITWPLSKLFEFRLHGTLAEPHWYPINFSMDLFDRKGPNGEDEDEEREP